MTDNATCETIITDNGSAFVSKRFRERSAYRGWRMGVKGPNAARRRVRGGVLLVAARNLATP
jgi:hypothetical protein